jgi:hypothetical protein
MYTVKIYKGDYYDRQMKANKDGAVAYVEHHFNSSSSTTASYAIVVTGYNASQTSKNWGRWYAKAVATHFGTQVAGDDGILVGGWDGRGDANLRETDMPAILLEPLFASNAMQADIIRSESGRAALARILVESIHRFFPQGGLVAFSVGHKYKKTNPNDLGAPLAGGGWEADYAEKVLEKAKTLLESSTERPVGRKLRVMRGDDVLYEVAIDEDDVIRWAPERDLLILPD